MRHAASKREVQHDHGTRQLCWCAGSGPAGATIFVGNLPNDIREREVEDLFIKVGTHSVSQLGTSWACCSALPPACAKHSLSSLPASELSSATCTCSTAAYAPLI